MTPNISNKSIYIIFIMSINIVSVVCVYKPILKETEKVPIFLLYSNYVDDKNMPVPYYYEEPLDVRKNKIRKYCNDGNYVTFTKFKKMYETFSLGSLIVKFKFCLQSETNPFEKIKYCCKNKTKNNDDQFISCLDQSLEPTQKTEMDNCFEKFMQKYRDIFGEDQIDFHYTFSIPQEIGKDTFKLFNTVTNLAEYNNTIKGVSIEIFPVFYKAIKNEDVSNIFKLSSDDVQECNSFYKYAEVEENIILYDIFEGFESYSDFMLYTSTIVKYLKGIEGPLVNNAELYDTFLKNQISFDDYRELHKPIPLLHETLYPLYSMRLQKLGYIPIEESLWNEGYSKTSDQLLSKLQLASNSSKKFISNQLTNLRSKSWLKKKTEKGMSYLGFKNN
ncbi:uncharacterized protein LOC113552423 [Rhopalosiphum maidis]|uniref:uncharacterized protein LOC113552423 n=1 Tax=Rhopalosiphum maidis TaxID=43146 RepID=UPI000EFE31DD|nr:uncharacterized protein LOC113552423 [Rhopalosiphum maidis]